jgi:lactate dehydrogenase-like 2-hydroxyacid dehydrogenase
MLALNRKLHRAYNRVREGNFALDGFASGLRNERALSGTCLRHLRRTE